VTLESYKLGGLDWRSHAHQLALAKQHINGIGDRLQNLQAIRNTAAPWQQQAIESIVPVATQLAARTEAAINHLSTIAEHSDQMKQSIDVFLDMATTQDKLDSLRDKVAAMES
jgi:hypothetical protein